MSDDFDHFDLLELRDAQMRHDEQFAGLREMLAFAKGHAEGLWAHLGGVDPDLLTDRAALARLPVLRKSDMGAMQKDRPLYGGLATRSHNHFRHVFMSPGPIFEPGSDARDWWRLGRFAHAAGIRMGDVVQNCFSYHLTPAGMMFESAIAAISATVLPAGTGQTDLQVEAAHRVGVTAYAGTPDYLKVILDRADELGIALKFSKAAVSGGALFPSLRQAYADRGIDCSQCYATADLGLIAYESRAREGMIVDEGVIVEIVRPGTGDPVPDGEVGEVVVSVLNPDYPLIRLATGDLSAVLPGQSPCGRTNMRIAGWMGRADQTTKIKGMFVRPEQVAELAARFPEAGRMRVIATRAGEQDELTLQIDGPDADPAAIETALPQVLNLRGRVECVAPESLPNDGKVIDDRRSYD